MKGFKLGWQQKQKQTQVLSAGPIAEEMLKNRVDSYNKGYEDGYCEAFIKLFNERAKEIKDPEAYYA